MRRRQDRQHVLARGRRRRPRHWADHKPAGCYNPRMTHFVALETPRLFVRRLGNDDLDALVAYRADPNVMRWQMWDSYDAVKGRAMIDELKQVEPFTANGYFQFGVELKATAELIGDLYFKMDAAGSQAELGYTLAPKHQGQGLATEAVRALLDHAFTQRKLHRVVAIADPHNAASINVMKRLGMRQEAHFRENVWFKGAWADDVVFAILAREWKSP